jgi:hypothetical protein
MSRRRALISAALIATLALGYEIAVRVLAGRDLIAAATRSELGSIGLGIAALGLRGFLLGFAPAWLLYAAALLAHAEWQRRR